MNIEKNLLEDHQIQLTVEVETEPWEKAKHRAAKRISKRVKIAGFRPGKAPYNAIVRQIGEGAIVEDALDIVIDEFYPKLIEESEIEPYGPGTVKEIPSLDPLKIEFLVPLQPDVELGDYQAVEVAYKVPKVKKKEIDQALEEAREQHAVYDSVERPAEDGDTVYLRVGAKRLGVEDEEEAVIFDQQFSSARLGEEESATDRQFFPGFSENLVGMAPMEEKTITYTYPEDHDDEDLQGVEAEFLINVTNIQTQELPALDDEFAKTVSDFDTFKEYKADLKTKLTEKTETEYESTYTNDVIAKVVEDSTIKFPPQAIEREKKDILGNMEYQLSRQGLSKELYLQFRGISEEELNAELDDTANDNVQRSIVLYEIARVEEIQADEQEFSETTNRTIQSVTAGMTPKQIKDLQKDGRMTSLITNIAADMTLQKTIDYLSTIAKGEPWPAEVEEAEDEVESESVEEAAPEGEAPVEDQPVDEVENKSDEEAAPEGASAEETPEEEKPEESEDA